MQKTGWVTRLYMFLPETDEHMRAFAEEVFASETKGEGVRDEISLFEEQDDCPILKQEMAYHLHTEEDIEKRWVLAERKM